jgi:hypothetical protein
MSTSKAIRFRAAVLSRHGDRDEGFLVEVRHDGDRRDHIETAQGLPPTASTVTESQTVLNTVKGRTTPQRAPNEISFPGNGAATLAGLTVPSNSMLRRTCDGEPFQTFDLNPNNLRGISLDSQAHRGSTAMGAGRCSQIQVKRDRQPNDQQDQLRPQCEQNTWARP